MSRKPDSDLVCALRETADRLENGARFQWSHQGACICGNLVQTLTRFSPRVIHDLALGRSGDWGGHARDHCPESSAPIDSLVAILLGIGLTVSDIAHLERLDDPDVMRSMGLSSHERLNRNERTDAVAYLRAMADLRDVARTRSNRTVSMLAVAAARKP